MATGILRRSPPRWAVIRSRVEEERTQLRKASAVLACLVSAVNSDAEVDVADVAAVALELVVNALDRLDIVELTRQNR
jgi:hypothetical protein